GWSLRPPRLGTALLSKLEFGRDTPAARRSRPSAIVRFNELGRHRARLGAPRSLVTQCRGSLGSRPRLLNRPMPVRATRLLETPAAQQFTTRCKQRYAARRALFATRSHEREFLDDLTFDDASLERAFGEL